MELQRCDFRLTTENPAAALLEQSCKALLEQGLNGGVVCIPFSMRNASIVARASRPVTSSDMRHAAPGRQKADRVLRMEEVRFAYHRSLQHYRTSAVRRRSH